MLTQHLIKRIPRKTCSLRYGVGVFAVGAAVVFAAACSSKGTTSESPGVVGADQRRINRAKTNAQRAAPRAKSAVTDIARGFALPARIVIRLKPVATASALSTRPPVMSSVPVPKVGIANRGPVWKSSCRPSCNRDAACLSGTCADGTCCATECTTLCHACTQAATTLANGRALRSYVDSIRATTAAMRRCVTVSAAV